MEAMQEMIPEVNEIDAILQKLLPEQKKDTLDWIESILTGNMVLSPTFFLKKIISLVNDNIQEWKDIFLSILILFIISAIFVSFMEAFKSVSAVKTARFLFLLCEMLLLIRVWKQIEEIGRTSMEQMISFMKIAVPGFMSCLAISGSTATALIFQKLLLGSLCAIEGMIITSVFPLLKVYIAFATIETMTGEGRFVGILELIKKAIHYLTKGCIYVISASQALQLLITPIIDKTNMNLARKTASAIPGVGDITESVSSVTMASLIAIKNSFGVLILVILLMIIVTPVIKIFGFIWTLKMSSAIGSICGDSSMTQSITYITEAGFLTLRLMIMLTALFLMTIALLTNATGGIG